MTRSMRTAALAAGCGAAAAALLLTAVPADAAVLRGGVDQIDDSYLQSCDRPDGTTITVLVHDVGTDTWKHKIRGPLAGFSYLDPWFGDGRGDIHSTYTNVETGRSWTTDYRDHDADRTIVSIVGTVQTAVAQNEVHFVVNDESGRPASRVDYHVEYTFTFDTHGTEDESDDTSEFVGVNKVVGQLDGSDFCDDAYNYTVA